MISNVNELFISEGGKTHPLINLTHSGKLYEGGNKLKQFEIKNNIMGEVEVVRYGIKKA